MRHHSLAIILLLLFAASPAASSATPPFEDGFSGFKWGAEVSELPGFESFRARDGVEFFRTPAKVYTIFDMDVEDVIFGFHENKLFAAFVQIPSMDAYGKLKTHLTQAYGKPEMKLTMKTEQTVYIWKGKDITIKIKIREKDGLIKLGVYYAPVSDKVNEQAGDLYLDSSPEFFPLKRDEKPERIPILRF
jgi:hypothetical protein